MEVYSFYKFINLNDLHKLKRDILTCLKNINIKGTVLLSSEGINANISQKNEILEKAIDNISNVIDLTDIFINKTKSKDIAFKKLKVKIKKEIIKFDNPIDREKTSPKNLESLSPSQWEQLLNEDIQLVDMRNSFEYSLGTFKGAINLGLKNFTDLKNRPKQINLLDKSKKTAIFCTGGIRCEKAGLYLNDLGFNQVYQLNGGIINYLNSNVKNNKWTGDCFVFDDRILIRN
jgi:UPF0176 protein